MKKLIAACALLLSSVAFAGIPAGYEEVETNADNQRVFVNNATGASFSIMAQTNPETISAKAVAEEAASQLGCKGGVEGDDNFAEASDCTIEGQSLNYAVIINGNDMVVFYANDKVTEEDVGAFANWIMSE